MIRVGDHLVLPQHGECVVKAIFKRNWSRHGNATYVLKPKNARFSLQRFVIEEDQLKQINQDI